MKRPTMTASQSSLSGGAGRVAAGEPISVRAALDMVVPFAGSGRRSSDTNERELSPGPGVVTGRRALRSATSFVHLHG
jgi:hypothetical protein